ncbi:hypothetical protein H6P81_002619 [Aristolochia fimbriata]|uniref:RNase H type-1 domain-containing protein n=1 Tax=Aristolochia fimbriata TaxID=158543 RepID=A0AAV7FDG9_ARIFI|nr:hypothetical protein H6P81_002619 [Aristolochia fimbriata]
MDQNQSNEYRCNSKDAGAEEHQRAKELPRPLAYIQHFILNLAKRCQPFSRLMKKDMPFEWDDAYRKAFNRIKAYLAKTPMLIDPIVGAEINHTPIEKICLALNFTIQKLQHYLLGYSTNLISRADLLKYIMLWPILSGLLAKWVLLLSEFEINFMPQRAIKGQALLNFLANHPVPAEWELIKEFLNKEIFLVEILPPWKMYFDWAARRNGVGAGVLFVSPKDDLLSYSFVLKQNCLNNVAEYQALLGLDMAVEMKIPQLKVYGDSALVIKQITGEFEVKKFELVPLWRQAGDLLAKIPHASLHYIPRTRNGPANALARIAASLAQFNNRPSRVPIYERGVIPLPTEEKEEEVEEKVEEKEESLPISIHKIKIRDRREPITNFVRHGTLLIDLRERVHICRMAPRYVFIHDILYRGRTRVLLRCLSKEEGHQMLQKNPWWDL